MVDGGSGVVRGAARVRTVGVPVDGGRRAIPARVVEPVTPPPDGCPVVAFGHGFLQRPASYDSLLAAIAARGYLVVAPSTGTGPWPSHRALADDLWHVALWARESTAWTGEGQGLVLGGHSMGAGAALLAASLRPDADAVVTLAAVQTRPPARLDAIGTPVLFVVGSQDRIVPPARTRRLYEAMTDAADWISLEGGYHCGFLDRARFRDAGCDRGDLPRREQIETTARLVGDWLDVRLRGAAGRPSGRAEPTRP
jgi:pimeloyl-ACP methyl ester carboxylesterase